ncbi:MAG: PhnA domain-containing protein [Bdellovibrionales bacterium]|nr:PhnA domain-containing protein [Oligoflexia bacterium]
MKLKSTPDLLSFFATYISDANPGSDSEATLAFISSSSTEKQQQVAQQIKNLLASSELPLDEFGSEANRWFGEEGEARSWLHEILSAFDDGAQSSVSVIVKDSNGTALNEGDSVQVIKDLKVKGGTSDLKRGTLIKKIHLIGDSDNIECRVDGSTLVLKTQFLKKS